MKRKSLWPACLGINARRILKVNLTDNCWDETDEQWVLELRWSWNEKDVTYGN